MIIKNRFIQIGYPLWGLMAVFMMSHCEWVVAASPDASAHPSFMISSFAAGQKYVIEPESFTPIGHGRLQYQITEVTGPNSNGQRISVNEIDCNTGQFYSPIKSWNENAQGDISDVKPGPPHPMTLRNRTGLYTYLKNSCQENLPDLEINW